MKLKKTKKIRRYLSWVTEQEVVFVFVCVCVYMQMHIYIYIYICIYMHLHMHVCMYAAEKVTLQLYLRHEFYNSF